MSSVQNRLAAIGYRVERRDLECWRVERIGPPSGDLTGYSAAPMQSRALSRWLDRLRDRPERPAYRLCLASAIE